MIYIYIYIYIRGEPKWESIQTCKFNYYEKCYEIFCAYNIAMEKILEAPMSIRVSNQVVDGQII